MTYLGVAVGEKGAPVGLLEDIWAEKEESYDGWMGGSDGASRASLRTAGSFMPFLIWVDCLGLPGLPDTGLDGAAIVTGTLSSSKPLQ